VRVGGEHGDEEEAHTAHRSSLSVKNGGMEAPQDSRERFLFSCTGVAAGLGSSTSAGANNAAPLASTR